jgi:hypothetical protein
MYPETGIGEAIEYRQAERVQSPLAIEVNGLGEQPERYVVAMRHRVPEPPYRGLFT